MDGQIIALGGGGFSDSSEPDLDVYVLEQSLVTKPKIGFIPTASGDADSYLVKFYSRFTALNCEPSHLPFFRRTPGLEEWVKSQSIIYVGGGNTKSMLAVWQAWALPALLMKAMQSGTVLAGISAGAICWFEYGITDSNAGLLEPLECLGFLPGSCCPHYSKEKERKPAYERLVSSGAVPDGMAIDDGAAIHFKNGAPYRVVAGTHGVGAYQITRTTNGATTQSVPRVETVQLYVRHGAGIDVS